MFIDFLYELRAHEVPVGAQEAVALAKALRLGLHDSSLDGLYHVARALCVHSEAQLDDFDLAFAKHFRGIELDAVHVAEQLLEWLADPVRRAQLSDEERRLLEALDPRELRRQLDERLREQDERHDRGSRYVGTGGTSPFGRAGEHPSGVQLGPPGGGRGGAIKTADARRYRPYRADLVLDVRQIEVALRKLRAFAREGAQRELDVEATIDATARNAGELELVTRPPRRPSTRVVLMMDVGGSMDPYARLLSQLFSAAKRATHWKELRTYYFHNCIYGRVYQTEGLRDPVRIEQLTAECGRLSKLVLVGDASMAPYELLGSGGYAGASSVPAIAWLRALREHFERAVWLNPELATEPARPDPWAERIGYTNTVETIRALFPMFPLTLHGLDQAIQSLMGRVPRGHSPRVTA
jgi:uncharacterized protein